MEPAWIVILDVLILLTAALVLGTAAEQIRQSAILGYLLAGMIVGPNCFGWVGSAEKVEVFAELGVALLLFTIGLEFSIHRLRRLGSVALIGGSLQVVVTLLAATSVAVFFGLELRSAIVLGAVVALSSTACVLRILVDRAALDSVYGRHALGILLFQDTAVIPLVLVTAVLSGSGHSGAENTGRNIFLTATLGVTLVAMFFFMFNFVIPKLFNLRHWVKNRDLPILLAIVVALGAVMAAHQIGISPAIAAFVAGVLLGGSPFAIQIRADVSSVRTLLVTIFFASIGLLGDPRWIVEHWGHVFGAVLAIIIGKAVIIWGILRLLRLTQGLAMATGLCLAQVGEFSFVLASMAHDRIISEHVFNLIISVMIVTLFLTPFLVTAAPYAAHWLEAGRMHRCARRRRDITGKDSPVDETAATASGDELDEVKDQEGKIFIIGFGPAGQRVAHALLDQHRKQMVVIDLNHRNMALAKGLGVEVQLGDATQREVLEHTQIHGADVIVVTVPDPNASRLIIHHCRFLAPMARIIVRARYHIMRWELQLAGATEVVDEEDQVGLRLAAEARKHLR